MFQFNDFLLYFRNAWNDLGNMGKDVAMEKYIEELTKVR